MTSDKSTKRNRAFYVQSEHVRFEPRMYWVSDSKGRVLTEPTTSKRTAERQCERMNKQKPEES